jgi:archaellum component FlaC
VDFQPMSPDEIERTMQFLLRQQAQFEANMARLSDTQKRTDADLSRVADQQVRFAADLERLGAKTENIADGLIGLTGIVGQLTNRVERLVETFERHLREDHGQRPS